MFVGDLVRFSVVDFDAVRYSCKKEDLSLGVSPGKALSVNMMKRWRMISGNSPIMFLWAR
jgi:hypothetical protein